jgi:glycerophosphoryl diester phosphodiesterase
VRSAFLTTALALTIGVSLVAAASADAAPASAGAVPGPGGTAPAASPGAADRHHHPMKSFDLQAHRGGIGERTESSLASFSHALEVGVSTLELDTQITKDNKVVVTHDRKTNPAVCADTAPAVAGDPAYPYVGKFVKDLTLRQLKTLDCGYQQRPGYPQQVAVPGSRMLELHQVFDLVKKYRAKKVMMNIETKVEAGAPQETAPRELFVRLVYAEIARSGLSRQVTIQSFDWGALMAMHRLDRRLPLVALTNYDFLQVGQPGASPWLGGIDADDFGGDFVRAAASIDGVVALSPNDGFPQGGSINDPNFRPYVTADMVRRAHQRGLTVIPWTVDDPATQQYMIDIGVDGLITNYPTRLRGIMADNGLRLPRQYRPHC